ncbi:type I secretion system permease/ATPase [Primorskyibacter sp. S87]|uniref:type I secretion system permease/ATPase n=1 Tax=Primorskyibacter sp. S87 TaxID=3415126 RepID=UPI003C7AE6C7
MRQGASREWDFPDRSPDPLASSVVAAMRLEGRDASTDALLAGVPLPADGLLTPPLAQSALEAQGFRAHLTRRRLSQLPDSVLPAILFLRGREACVLVSRRGDDAQVVWPTRSDDPQSIPEKDLADTYAGHALLLRPEEKEEAGPSSPETQRHWYWSVARRFWPDYIQVILASMLVNLLGLAVPIFTMNVYDRVFPTSALITLWSLAAGVGVALFFDAILKWLRAAVIDNVGRRVDQAVSSEIFRHIADLRLQAGAQPSGELINNLKDYEQVRDFFSSQTLATITDLCFSLLFVAVIFYIGGPLAYPPAVALALVLIMGLMVLGPLRSTSNATRRMSGVKNAVAVEAVTELETLKAVAGQGRMQSRWERQVAESARLQDRARKLATFATTATALAQQAASVGIVIIGVYLALDGNLTMGAVIASMILSGRALAPTAALSGLFVRASFAFSTLRSLNALMSRPSDKARPAATLNARIDLGSYEFRDVSLEYEGAKLPSLVDISFAARAQERIGLIGPVGAGKTSLVRLMSGLYSPTSGLATIDGLNIDQLDPATLRRDVQMVTQDAVLFSGTLAENIAFGMPQATGEDVLRVARLTGVDALAAAHPQGFAMPITERGRNLSGGQRQMVALARALLPRPRVLILDEPTSSMDSASESRFVQRLKHVLEQRPMTVVISTHRMGLLDLVDRVILLDNGKIRMDGNRAQVLARLNKGEP